MKQLKFIALGLSLTLLSVLTFVGVAQAQAVKTGPSVTVAANQTVDSMLFASGNTIDIAGTVNGDVYCVGQNITISGTVNGDVFCAGQTITLSGVVDGSVRVAGQTVTLSGQVDGSVTVGAQTFLTQRGAVIGRDLLGGTQNGTLNGNIGRDLMAGATSMTVNGEIGRNIDAAGENLTIGSTGKVGGGIAYTSNSQPTVNQGGQVAGAVTVTAPKQQNREARNYSVLPFSIFLFIYIFVAMMVAALALVLLFPSFFHGASNKALKAPGRTSLIGLAAIFLAPVVLVVLLVSLIGTPLGVLALLIWLVIVFVSGPLSGYMLGRLILKDSKSPMLIMLTGASLLVVLYFIPILGFLAMLAAYIFGVGMFLSEAMRRLPKPSQKVA